MSHGGNYETPPPDRLEPGFPGNYPDGPPNTLGLTDYILQSTRRGTGFINGESYVAYLDDNVDTSSGWFVTDVVSEGLIVWFNTSTGETKQSKLPPDTDSWIAVNGGHVVSAKIPKETIRDYNIKGGTVVTIRARYNAPEPEWAKFKAIER